MRSFVELVLDQLEKSKDITQLTYVVPSRRVATFLSQALARRIDKPVFLPDMLSIEEFIEQLAGVTVSPDIDLLPLFYESYLKVQPFDEQESYDDFLGWAPTILKDFNEIDRYLVPPEDFFQYLGNIKELEDWHWSLGEDQTPMISKYLKFWKRLYLYYQEFTKACQEKGVAYQGLAYRLAHAKAESTKAIDKNPLIFMGLNALNTAESQIVQQFLAVGVAEIFWDTDAYYMERSYHEAGKFIRSYNQEWKYYSDNELNIIGANFACEKSIEIAGVSGNIGMVQVAAGKLATIAPDKIENTVVILADENLLIPLLTALPENIKNYNVTMGLSLDKLPIASFILDLLKLFSEKTEQGFYFKNVLKFLESPFTAHVLDKEIETYKSKISKANLVHVTLKDLEAQEEDALKKLLSTERSVNSILNLIDFLIQKIKNSLLSEGNKRMELEQLMGLKEVIGNLRRLLDTGHNITDLRTLTYIFRQLLPLKKLDFIGEPVKGLQIMGLLETRALDYKNIIMLSVNEGILPAGKSTASYIPYDMKRRFNLPTYSDKDSVYAYHFYRLLHRVETATYIYNTEPGKLGGAEKSRFLVQLETNDNVAHDISTRDYIYKNEAISNELLQLQKTDAYFKRLHEIAAKGFSPSALTSYVRNPIDFYRQKILRINQLEEVEESIALNTMGSIIHEALDKLYAQHLNKPLQKSDFKEMRLRLSSELDQAYQSFYPSVNKPLGRNRIIYEVAGKFIHQMIGMDEKLVESGSELIIRSVERKLETTIDLQGVGKVKLHGMVDRIDEVDGKLRIIDYKTGSVEKGDVGLEPEGYDAMRETYKKAKAFQILMYAYLYFKNESPDQEVSAGMISFKKFQNGFVPFSIKSGRSYQEEKITPEILGQFEEQLFKLLDELFDAHSPLTEKEV